MALDLSRIGEAEAARIQAELFLPAELEALAVPSPPDGPGQLVRDVRRRLVAGAYRSRFDGRNPHRNRPDR